jgi:hypothetical protein
MSDDDYERQLKDLMRARNREAAAGKKSDNKDLEDLNRRAAMARARSKAAERAEQDQPTDYGHDYGDLGEDILGKDVQVWPIAR